MTPVKSQTLEMFEAQAKAEPMLNFIPRILGWFAISAEVFLRRDFGERYFTRSKFLAGLLLLLFFLAYSNFQMPTLGGFMSPGFGSPEVNAPNMVLDPETGEYVLVEAAAIPINWGNLIMKAIIVLYILLSIYHTLNIWFRNAMNRPLFSYDHGLTWLEPLGRLLLVIPAFFMGLVLKLYALTLPASQRNLSAAPQDARSFAEWIIEPVALIALGYLCSRLGLSPVSTWLFFSAFSIIFFTTIRHEIQKNQMLDFRDQMINSMEMQQAVTGDTDTLRLSADTKQVISQVAAQVEKSPETMEAIRVTRPSVAAAMEALNPKLKAMSSNAVS